MSITVGTNSWATVAEADTYFTGRFGVSTLWSGLVTASKEAALITSYKNLMNSGLFSLPVEGSTLLKEAQCEQSLFLINHQTDMDVRLGLMAQGVVKADLVGETYDLSKSNKIIVAPVVAQMLSSLRVDGDAGYVGALERDEEEEVE